MNFAHLLILVVMINAASGVDEWTRSRMAYIKVINTFLEQYYNACRDSCHDKNSRNIIEEPTKIDENLQGSEHDIITQAKEKLNHIRNNFKVIKGNDTISDSNIIKGNTDYAERVRAAVRKYCTEVTKSKVIRTAFKDDKILLKGWLVGYLYAADLGFENNSQNEFEKDCPDSKENPRDDSHTPQTQGSFAGPSNYNNNVYQRYP